MTRAKITSGSVDTVLWIVTILAQFVMIYFMAASAMIELGAAAHDAFCPEHGWAVGRA